MKIMVFGDPGAGKSTFATALAQKTNIKLYHIDTLREPEDKKKLNKKELGQKISSISK
jgi:adenylate kinase family enzyme